MFLNRVCQALAVARVPYAIAGGYAVALHGAVRGTVDVDLVIRLQRRDFERAELALGTLGLVSRLPIAAAQVFSFREEYIRNRNLLAWSFWNPANPAEIVDILIAEDLDRCKRVRVRTAAGDIWVVSKRDLVRMKTAVGRPQDLEDVRALEALSRKP